MFTVRPKLLLTCVLFSSFATAQQDVDTHSAEAPGFDSGSPFPGSLSDNDPGSRFFGLLRSASLTSEVPFSFQEAVDLSSAIARGYLVDVIPGREFSRKRGPLGRPVSTILLKLQSTAVLKGEPQGVYLIQYAASPSMINALKEEFYDREMLFLLVPGTNYFDSLDVEITTPREAEIELNSGRPVYTLMGRASLFTMSADGNLTSPLQPSIDMEYIDLYTEIGSLDDLASHITDIQSQQTQ